MTSTFTHFRATLLLSAWVALGAGIVPGQTTLIPRHTPATPEYILGPGDQVSIHVVDLDDIPDRPMRIDPNGYIDLPLIGRTEAGGLSIEQLREQLRTELTKYINEPQVSINLIDNQSRTVSVIGAVNSPGVHALQGPQHLIEAISMAGGVRADAGSRVILTRESRWGELPLSQAKDDSSGGYSTATLSLETLLSAGNPADNILIDPGDVISVPKADIVYCLGTVKRAGGFPLASTDSISLLQTLTLAEGLDKDAAPGKARILRTPPGGDGQVKEIPVNISRILNGTEPDVRLYANDILYVPGSFAKSSARRTAEAVLAVATGVAIYRH